MQSTPEGRAALAAQYGTLNRSITPPQAREKSEADKRNEMTMGVHMNGLGTSMNTQMTNAASDKAQRGITANADRQAADRARLRGQSNAGSLDARARQSDAAR